MTGNFFEDLMIEFLSKVYRDVKKERDNLNKPIGDFTGKFSDFKDHLDYLQEQGFVEYGLVENIIYAKTKKLNEDIIIKEEDEEIKLYHGTTIGCGKNIIKDGFMKSGILNANNIEFNKIFFTKDIELAKEIGRYGGLSGLYTATRDYIVLECNLNNYDLYQYKVKGALWSKDEHFVWGNVDIEDIKHIYLFHRNDFIKELSKEELLNLGV